MGCTVLCSTRDSLTARCLRIVEIVIRHVEREESLVITSEAGNDL